MLGGRQKSGKAATGEGKISGKEGMKEGIEKGMSLTKLFDAIRTAKRVILIEDHPGYEREIKARVMELNPGTEILAARTLEDSFKFKSDVDKETVVLSDYNFPRSGGMRVMPEPLARRTHSEFAGSAKAYAIVTLAESLDATDRDLECFRVGKNEFIGERRLEEMKKKKVLVAPNRELILGLAYELRKRYPGYVLAAPGIERTDVIPVEIMVLASSKKREEKELRKIVRGFPRIFGRKFDAALLKTTIYAEDVQKE